MSINSVLKTFIDEDLIERKEYEEGFLIDSIDDADIEPLKNTVRDQFGVSLSEEYIEFLRLSNGLSVNGLNVYGGKPYDEDYYINGIVDLNSELWTEPTLTNYFSYGDESSTRLIYNKESKLFEAVDSVTWEKLDSFNSFGELLEYVIKTCHIFD